MDPKYSRFAIFGLIFAAAALAAGPVRAHQPRLAVSPRTAVIAPEVSKAYYGDLAGAPAEFVFKIDRPFLLYAGLLVPDRAGAKTDLSLEITRDGNPVARLSAGSADWLKMHEPFAGDDYLKGPEYRQEQAPAGSYVLRVSAPIASGRYVLAVGEVESFPPGETLAALRVIPKLKTDFFGRPRVTFLFSVFGAIETALALFLGALLGLVAWPLARFLPGGRRSGRYNVGRRDRLIRSGLGLALLAAGLWFWSFIAVVAAGFLFFEAVAGWCGLYAVTGRNTCPAKPASLV